MKFIFTILFSFLFLTSNFGQTRNVLVDTNGAVVQPTNIWTANATNARNGLGLGSAATNPASAFQLSSLVLSNVASSNGVNLTNLQATNIIGVIPSSNIPTVTLTNISGVLSVSSGGTGGTNALEARTNLGLGTASTNPSSAFQPSSSVLTNISLNDGSSLTNITAANIVGTVGLASNITGTAPLATNVTGVIGLANGGTAGTNATSARTSLGATTIGANLFTLANPDDVRFVRLNANNSVSALTAADFRTALSVGTNLGTVTSVGMTVPNIFSLSTPTITSSGTFAITLANQTSRQVFIAPNGGGIPSFRAVESDDLPSLAISKITGLQTALDGKLSTTGTASLATNITGIVALANGGTSGTNAESARAGLGATTVGSAVFTLPNPSAVRFLRYNADNTVSTLSDTDFRTAIGLNTAATNPSSAFQSSSATLSNLSLGNGSGLTNVTASAISFALAISNTTGLQATLDGKLATNGSAAGLTSFPTLNQNTTGTASNVTGVVAIINGGTGSTNAADARTALGLGSAATSAVTAFQPSSTVLSNLANNNGASLTNITAANIGTVALASNVNGTVAISNGGSGATTAGGARTNFGITWSALTNTNSDTFQNALFGNGTNPVLVTNGIVVSPTNFWQNVPPSAIFNGFQNFTFDAFSATNYATNFPNLLVYSVSPNVENITNTIILPTNGNIGNKTTIIHTGKTNSTTAVRQSGSGENLITINGTQESISFIYNGTNWSAFAAPSFINPIYFSGTNSTYNAAVSRTNIGLVLPELTNTSVANFRTAIGLGSSATNSASAFQPSSATLSNLANNNGTNLTNISLSNVVGLQSVLDGKLATNGNAANLTNFPTFNQNTTGTASNVTGVIALANGGTGATNASGARSNLGLDSAATNPASVFQPSSATLSNLANNNGTNLTNISLSGVVGALATNGNGGGLTNLTAANITGSVAIANGGTGSTNASGARTNLSLGWSALTNSNAATSLLGFTTNGQVVANTTNTLTFTNAIAINGTAQINTIEPYGGGSGISILDSIITDTNGVGGEAFSWGSGVLAMGVPISFATTNIAATTRANLGFSSNLNTLWTATNASNARTSLGFSADLTSLWTATNASNARSAIGLSLFVTNTNDPVFVNTNGDVISPTNFWQRAPIQTLVQDFTGITVNQTNNATNARNVYVYSLATNVSGISNTIILPTNTLTFNGDEVTLVHKGTTNTTTVVRQAGSTNNLITLNKFDESVKFIRELGQWDFYHNISFVEPIQFSGTNVAANAAASRTNLGLGGLNNVAFNSVNVGEATLTYYGIDATSWGGGKLDFEGMQFFGNSGTDWDFGGSGIYNLGDLQFANTTNAATTRTNLGLPLVALTNTSNTTFQQAIFTTNAAPTNPATPNFGDYAAWMGVSIVTNGVTNVFKIPLYK